MFTVPKFDKSISISIPSASRAWTQLFNYIYKRLTKRQREAKASPQTQHCRIAFSSPGQTRCCKRKQPPWKDQKLLDYSRSYPDDTCFNWLNLNPIQKGSYLSRIQFHESKNWMKEDTLTWELIYGKRIWFLDQKRLLLHRAPRTGLFDSPELTTLPPSSNSSLSLRFDHKRWIVSRIGKRRLTDDIERRSNLIYREGEEEEEDCVRTRHKGSP